MMDRNDVATGLAILAGVAVFLLIVLSHYAYTQL